MEPKFRELIRTKTLESKILLTSGKEYSRQ